MLDISYCAVGSYVVMWLWNVAILWKEYLKLKINLAIWRKHYTFVEIKCSQVAIWHYRKIIITYIFIKCIERTHAESSGSQMPARR